MESAPHLIVLGLAFLVAFALGAIVNKTNFCVMGAVSDWVVIGDSGRLRAWILAMAIAILGVGVLELSGIRLGTATFPPYRTATFAWARYVLGGVMFGVGMTLGSGCGNKTLIRLGSGNLKSLVVMAVAAPCAYLMLWTDFYVTAFDSWLEPLAIGLGSRGIANQSLGALVGAGESANALLGIALGLCLAAAALSSRALRGNGDNMLAGVAVGLAVIAGWAITAGSLGEAWKEYATMVPDPPSRVATQSFTFISPMGDLIRYLISPARVENVNFGVVALVGVVAGSGAWSLAKGSFHVEWFNDVPDALRHIVGGVLMGIGGVLAMGCTIGQAVTGVSTLAAGSFLATASIVAGSAATLRWMSR